MTKVAINYQRERSWGVREFCNEKRYSAKKFEEVT